MNYTINVYITKNEETLDFFERFTKVKIADRPWEVQAKDTMGGDGIIELVLKEDFENMGIKIKVQEKTDKPNREARRKAKKGDK